MHLCLEDTTARMQDDSRDGGGSGRLEHVLEVERLRTNIGHIRVKMLGTYFPDKVEESREAISPTRAICGIARQTFDSF